MGAFPIGFSSIKFMFGNSFRNAKANKCCFFWGEKIINIVHNFTCNSGSTEAFMGQWGQIVSLNSEPLKGNRKFSNYSVSLSSSCFRGCRRFPDRWIYSTSLSGSHTLICSQLRPVCQFTFVVLFKLNVPRAKLRLHENLLGFVSVSGLRSDQSQFGSQS